jgi:hypothetical protein
MMWHFGFANYFCPSLRSIKCVIFLFGGMSLKSGKTAMGFAVCGLNKSQTEGLAYAIA